MTERGVPPSATATAAAVPAPAQAAPQAELLVPRPAPRRGLAEEEREGKKRRLRPREEPEHQRGGPGGAQGMYGARIRVRFSGACRGRRLSLLLCLWPPITVPIRALPAPYTILVMIQRW